MHPTPNGSSVTFDSLAYDVRRIAEQLGRAPSPATGDKGSGLLRSVAELIEREDAREERAKLQAEITARRVAFGQWLSIAASVVAALAAVAALVSK